MSKEIAIKALEIALKAGAQQSHISYSEACQNILATHNGEIERLHYSNGASLFIQLYVDERYGAFSTNMMDIGNLNSFIKQGIKATRLLTADPCRTLPNPSLYFKGEQKDLGQFDNNYNNISAIQKKELILNSYIPGTNWDKRLISMDCEYEDILECSFMIDSQGFQAEALNTMYTLSAECSVIGDNDARPEGWWYHSAMHSDKLQWMDCSRIALDRALAKLNPGKLKSGKYKIIVENSVASKLISPIISALNGGSIQQKNSFLMDALGKKIFSEKMTLIDEPHRFGAVGSRYHDSEGIATAPHSIIEDGVIKTYFINTYYANKLGTTPTIEGPSVPILKTNMHKGASSTDLIKEVERGILITGFNGGNCNQGTGDFSYGIEGHYFEGGRIKHPINEMNITGNMTTLWSDLLYVADDARECSKWQIPAIAFEKIDITGI